jgi:hypothetical protein
VAVTAEMQLIIAVVLVMLALVVDLVQKRLDQRPLVAKVATQAHPQALLAAGDLLVSMAVVAVVVDQVADTVI